MPNNSRAHDIWAGICCCHKKPKCVGMAGPIITWSHNVNVNNRGQARLTDITIGGCGHTGVVISSAVFTNCNNLGVARIGDAVAGCNIGKIVTGSPDTYTE